MSDSGKPHRRSFMAQVIGGGVMAAGLVGSTARAQVTDSDGGATADPAGRGRGPARTSPTGRTDSDSGAAADRAGYGRTGAPAGSASTVPSMDRFSGAVSGVARAPMGCRTFGLNGAIQIVQSDGITVQWEATSQPPNLGGNISLSGSASHHNNNWVGTFSGVTSGFIRGNTISFRIRWRINSQRDNMYEETGVYEGTINADGQASGTVYGEGRPRPQRAVTWYIPAPLACIT